MESRGKANGILTSLLRLPDSTLGMRVRVMVVVGKLKDDGHRVEGEDPFKPICLILSSSTTPNILCNCLSSSLTLLRK